MSARGGGAGWGAPEIATASVPAATGEERGRTCLRASPGGGGERGAVVLGMPVADAVPGGAG